MGRGECWGGGREGGGREEKGGGWGVWRRGWPLPAPPTAGARAIPAAPSAFPTLAPRCFPPRCRTGPWWRDRDIATGRRYEWRAAPGTGSKPSEGKDRLWIQSDRDA